MTSKLDLKKVRKVVDAHLAVTNVTDRDKSGLKHHTRARDVTMTTKLTFPNCSKYALTSSTVVVAERPPTKIFFVRDTCKKRMTSVKFVVLRV